MKARDNPFRTDRILTVRWRPQSATWAELMSRLASLRYRAAITGPHGSGKTTLLEDLGERLAALGLGVRPLRLDRANPAFPRGFLSRFLADLGERDAILLDGADQMTRLAWRRLKSQTRRAAGLIITSRRAGLLPTLIECTTTPELLEEIVRELLGEASPELRETTRALFARHNGDLRKALRELYHLYANRPL